MDKYTFFQIVLAVYCIALIPIGFNLVFFTQWMLTVTDIAVLFNAHLMLATGILQLAFMLNWTVAIGFAFIVAQNYDGVLGPYIAQYGLAATTTVYVSEHFILPIPLTLYILQHRRSLASTLLGDPGMTLRLPLLMVVLAAMYCTWLDPMDRYDITAVSKPTFVAGLLLVSMLTLLCLVLLAAASATSDATSLLRDIAGLGRALGSYLAGYGMSPGPRSASTSRPGGPASFPGTQGVELPARELGQELGQGLGQGLGRKGSSRGSDPRRQEHRGPAGSWLAAALST